jgi:hypothetical protein
MGCAKLLLGGKNMCAGTSNSINSVPDSTILGSFNRGNLLRFLQKVLQLVNKFG